ncbi:hypothetical protein FS837_004858 [Tulasnella sp. UAMH 9824]|nr:hypothetical protein FS837_004858 [Tulasnella sp. UAMH 9824]
MISTIQRISPFLKPAAVLLSLGASQPWGLEHTDMYFVIDKRVDAAFPLERPTLLLALLRKLALLARYHKGETRPPFVILILIHYEGWTTPSNVGRSMQLDSVKEDLKQLLDYLKYRHGDTTKTWYILSDFECVYKDHTGKERPLTRCGLPDRETIVKFYVLPDLVFSALMSPPGLA